MYIPPSRLSDADPRLARESDLAYYATIFVGRKHDVDDSLGKQEDLSMKNPRHALLSQIRNGPGKCPGTTFQLP